ncbi:MAG: peptidylprolyl isomerase [Deltaproteobacteria bacterium]|nr:peptidylprolyl isomerase [Deltaproteobacteria bacterium]
MKVKDGAYVTIDYTLTLDSGETVDQSQPGQPLGFLFRSGQVIPGLEGAIDGMEAGESVEFTVEPQDAYGMPDEQLVRELARNSFPDDTELKPGMVFQATGPNGPVPFKIKEVGDEKVMADFNHPLAGEKLHFKVVVAEVREPTDRDMEDEHDSGCCEGCEGCD